jgi:ornithine decarboxylase
VLAALAGEGSGFDVSSLGEINLLRSLGVAPTRWIHTHPIKRTGDIRTAFEYGCRTFIVDNVEEMGKFVDYRESVSLLLRIGFGSPEAAVDLSNKFGCDPQATQSLLRTAGLLGLRVDGLSFHVGSQCRSPRAIVEAIYSCGESVEEARRDGLRPIRIVDIGGGFPARYTADVASIEDFCSPINQALKSLPNDTRVIAEPGRFVAAPAMMCVATVVGKSRRKGAVWYYLDDGVFGSFNGRVFDKGANYRLRAVSASSGTASHSVLAGPTCDGIDVIAEMELPELQLGDLIVAEMMGAYTTVCASEFNSIPKTRIVVENGSLIDDQQTAPEFPESRMKG